MNEPSSTTNGQNGNSSHQNERTAHQQSPGGLFDSIAAGFRQGAEDAKAAAEHAIPHLKAAAADLAYGLSYGVAFAGAFQWTLAKNITPESVKAGFDEGLRAGRQAAEHWAEKVKHRTGQAAKPEAPAQPAPPTEGAQPGVA